MAPIVARFGRLWKLSTTGDVSPENDGREKRE